MNNAPSDIIGCVVQYLERPDILAASFVSQTWLDGVAVAEPLWTDNARRDRNAIRLVEDSDVSSSDEDDASLSGSFGDAAVVHDPRLMFDLTKYCDRKIIGRRLALVPDTLVTVTKFADYGLRTLVAAGRSGDNGDLYTVSKLRIKDSAIRRAIDSLGYHLGSDLQELDLDVPLQPTQIRALADITSLKSLTVRLDGTIGINPARKGLVLPSLKKLRLMNCTPTAFNVAAMAPKVEDLSMSWRSGKTWDSSEEGRWAPVGLNDGSPMLPTTVRSLHIDGAGSPADRVVERVNRCCPRLQTFSCDGVLVFAA